MATANVEKVSQFGKAVSLCGEAQNIYDFQAYAQASGMHRDSHLLRIIFAKSAMLCASFPDSWALLVHGDEDCVFFYPGLERALTMLCDDV